MDYLHLAKFTLLISVSAFYLQFKADGRDSVVFLDSPSHPYLHTSDSKLNSMDLSEVGASILILLGFSPPASILAESSLKLSEVLLPNPFDRPRAVFILEAKGIEDPSLFSEHPIFHGGGFLTNKVLGSKKANIELLDEDDVSLSLLDETEENESNHKDKELHDFANWFGGSYVGTLDALDGELKLPLASGRSLSLQLSKKADREFAISLASLLSKIREAGEMHKFFVQGMRYPAEILTGCFTGIQALREHYGSHDVVEQGKEIFTSTVAKLFDSLQASYGGKIVGVILLNENYSLNSERMLDVKFSARVLRSLEEVSSPSLIRLKEIYLVRRALAWITGIILLASTLIGIYFLFSMPLTKDTLLYANVKLD